MVLLTLLPILGAGFVSAEETSQSGGISIELSSAEARGQNCLLSFVAENSYDSDIDGAVYEAVLFGTEGKVALLTLLDFAELPAGRLRVRQFQFNDMACNEISRILINGVQECETQGDMADACLTGLELKSRLETEVIG
ncbi:hypothetical protein [Ruegeria sp. Ofav3-42]|uniref:hypothetical protein n=1 Tax=Ruegeria sp. Ofav3-42 TaxID=2917759 RepID=UPI001EF3EFC6|nr:hypothetical protein [Ruegeria sp. Ofav3-42]MCG7519039.1 hypothetical protein [Ruegeria sp. Ofav3-42]